MAARVSPVSPVRGQCGRFVTLGCFFLYVHYYPKNMGFENSPQTYNFKNIGPQYNVEAS